MFYVAVSTLNPIWLYPVVLMSQFVSGMWKLENNWKICRLIQIQFRLFTLIEMAPSLYLLGIDYIIPTPPLQTWPNANDSEYYLIRVRHVLRIGSTKKHKTVFPAIVINKQLIENIFLNVFLIIEKLWRSVSYLGHINWTMSQDSNR